MNLWLFKTEPDEFGIDQLREEPEKAHCWDGIRNYQARNFLRDQVAIGDRVFIYHSSCKRVGIAGTAVVVKAAYADPAQFDPKSRYYDAKATEDQPRWLCVDIRFEEQFAAVIPLNALKKHPELQGMVLIKQGRLSVQPVTPREWQVINGMR